MLTAQARFTRLLEPISKAIQWLRLTAQSVSDAGKGSHLATSMDIANLETLKILLGRAPGFYSRFIKTPPEVVMGWGRKKSGQRAITLAKENAKKFLLLEDGFLRSADRHAPTLSLNFDDQGIYYDSATPSRIEKLIVEPISAAERKRTRSIIEHWRMSALSKYNSNREYDKDLPSDYVLLLDQVAGDMSIAYGMVDNSTFDRMLKAALEENPDETIVVKVHPDVFSRAKSGHYDVEQLSAMARVVIIAEGCHPVRLIEQAKAVYTASSQVGFEALIWDKKVRCFGMPFYAGWGLTDDELPQPARRSKATLEQLVHAALVKYPRYVDPERRVECEVETVMQHIALQRQFMIRFPEQVYAVGFSRWKRPILKSFMAGSRITFVKRLSAVPDTGTVVVWGARAPADAPATMKFLYLEDGFLRSSGLGADLIKPLSWVIDDLGIYYNASKPSRLEVILQSSDFKSEMLERAGALRQSLVAAGVTKYNLGGEEWQGPTGAARTILVPGQVEADASIRYGAKDVKTNLGLLQAVRAANPDAYVIYKPHPDVVAGLRKAGSKESEAEQFCDEIVVRGDTVAMLKQVDEVHTMTSLLGFEALIRNVDVVCYGQPFYAGWGLTRDIYSVERRTRRLKLDELVAGALILYPTYLSRSTSSFTTPEQAMQDLLEWRKQGPSKMPMWRRALRAVLTVWAQTGLKE